MTLVGHLERYLGEIEVGWSRDADGEDLSFQVVRFGRGPAPGTVTFSTIGLSRFELRSATSGKAIRHELVIAVPESLRDGPVPGLLQQVAQEAREAGRALLRGDVIGPRGPLFAGSVMEALYVSVPTCFPDGFGSCREGANQIVIAWLVPVSAAEADYVGRLGWSAFEDRLVEADPDLTDIYRTSLL